MELHSTILGLARDVESTIRQSICNETSAQIITCSDFCESGTTFLDTINKTLSIAGGDSDYVMYIASDSQQSSTECSCVTEKLVT